MYLLSFNYHPRMRIGNNFSRVCLCVSFCVFVCLLVYRYILTMSRSSLSIKVIGSRSRSNEKLTYVYLPATSVCLYANKTY